MRISDWSSDVCSADLAGQGAGFAVPGEHRCPLARGRVAIPAALREGPGFPAAAARACAPARAASFPDHWKVVERAAVVPSVPAEQRRRHRKGIVQHLFETPSLCPRRRRLLSLDAIETSEQAATDKRAPSRTLDPSKLLDGPNDLYPLTNR